MTDHEDSAKSAWDDWTDLDIASELVSWHSPGELAPLESERINAATHYLLAQSPASRRVVRARLEALLNAVGVSIDPERFAWERLSSTHVTGFCRAVIDRYAPSTARATCIALRGVLRVCRVLGYVDGDAWWSLTESMLKVPGERLPPGRALSTAEVSALYRAGSERDRVMLALLFGAGLRRSEAVRIGREHFDERGLRVIGKGDRERLVPLPRWARETLEQYAPREGSLLGLTPSGVYYALGRLCDRAGVPRCSPHDGRRTCFSELLDVADTATVAAFAGHRSTDTTRRYDRRGERALADAVTRVRDVR